jgi:flagellar biosynthesis/type III secretory pathway M-ring protein FliF/YscJ
LFERSEEIMGDALIWVVVLLIIAVVFWSLVRESNRKMNRTVEEYERELADTRSSMMRAGMLELDKFVGNEREKRAAVEYISDENQGMTKTGGKDDGVDRTAGQR